MNNTISCSLPSSACIRLVNTPHNLIINNTQIRQNFNLPSIYVGNGNNVTIQNNVEIAVNSSASGIYLNGGSNNTIVSNIGRDIFFFNTHYNEIIGNSINSTANNAILLMGSSHNTFLKNKIGGGLSIQILLDGQSVSNKIRENNITGPIWIVNEGSNNVFSNSSTGNIYYFANGSGAWTVFNITDNNSDGYADSGSSLPFSSATVSPYWQGPGEDWHPFTTISSTPAPICGNSEIEAGEVCDGNFQSCITEGGYEGTQSCNEECSGYGACETTLYCGDAICNGDETCSTCEADCGSCPPASELPDYQVVVTPTNTTINYVTFEVRTVNLGNASATAESYTNDFSYSRVLHTVPPLGIGESDAYYVDAPCSPGQLVTLRAYADSTFVINESNESNNEGSAIGRCENLPNQMPDLLVSLDLTSNFTNSTGTFYLVNVTVKNNGTEIATPSETQMSQRYNVEANGNAAYLDLGQIPVHLLFPGQSNTTIIAVNCKQTTSFLTAQADSLDTVNESNEDNNVTLILLACPDLIINFGEPQFLSNSSGTYYTISITTKNNASDYQYSYPFANSSITRITYESVTQDVQIPYLEPAETNDITVALRCSLNGTVLTAQADFYSSVNESNETNNLNTTFVPPCPPDLVVSLNKTSGFTNATAAYDVIAVTVSNIGETSAGASITALSFPTEATSDGVVTYDGNYTVVTYRSNGTFNVTGTVVATVLVVAGGGAGGASNIAGGGGAGGLIYATSYSATGNINVVVGAGGVGSTVDAYGLNGNDSSFGTLVAIGGGGGGSADAHRTGQNGGSGGGASAYGINESYDGLALQPDSASGGYGNNGSYGTTTPNYGAGGGGGAGGSGGTGTITNGGAGGAGLNYTIDGSNTYYAGGGGGAINTPGTPGVGGSGIGGNGAIVWGVATNGADHTGSGGGGGNSYGTPGGSGGSGIVIIRYRTNANIPLSDVNISVPELAPGETNTSYVTIRGSQNMRTLYAYADNSGVVNEKDESNNYAYLFLAAYPDLTVSINHTTNITNGSGTYYILNITTVQNSSTCVLTPSRTGQVET
jgi:subtilase family serine protease